MTILLYVLLGLLLAALLLSLMIGWKISGMIVHPMNWAYDSVVDEEEKRGHITRAWFEETVQLEEFTLPSLQGYELHCALWLHTGELPFADKKPRVVVIVHGFTYCLLGGIKYAAIFHALGFDCLLYDHRNHGRSGRAPTTMGYYESRDLNTVCDWARARFGEDAFIGTHGESMGAATVMLQASQYPSLAFAIEDCGYSDLKKELSFALRHRFHLPAFPLVSIASLFSRLRGGVFFSKVRPIDSVRRCENLPMLFIHGDADGLVPFNMLQANYDAKPGKRAIQAFPEAGHAGCYHSNPATYAACVEAFLSENGLLTSEI